MYLYRQPTKGETRSRCMIHENKNTVGGGYQMWWTGFRSRLGSIPTSAQDDIIRYDVMVHDASARAHGTVPALPRLLRRLGTHQSCSRPFLAATTILLHLPSGKVPLVLSAAGPCFGNGLLHRLVTSHSLAHRWRHILLQSSSSPHSALRSRSKSACWQRSLARSRTIS